MNEYGFLENGSYGYIGGVQAAKRSNHKPRGLSFDMELEKIPNGVFYFILVFGLIIAAAID
ncbi:MAG: hypothetical protein EOM14_03985 [Clostridia bacterium]|nr:hypothetical protein [Clostridia bacterium]